MQHTLYTLTPIDQTEGLEDGNYVVTNGLAFFEVSYCKQFSFHEEFTDCSGLTHYLRPISTVALDNAVQMLHNHPAKHLIQEFLNKVK